MLLANNAAHTRNLLASNKVSLYVQNPQSPGQKVFGVCGIHIHTYIHIYMYVCMYVCMYV